MKMFNKLFAVALICAGMSVGSNRTYAAGLLFTPVENIYQYGFEDLEIGDPISTLPGWTNSHAGAVGTAPRDPANNTSNVALSTTNTTNSSVKGDISLSNSITNSKALVLSGWFNWSGSGSSNARVSILGPDAVNLGGFGISGGKFQIFNAGQTSSLTASSQMISGVWYELAMAIDFNATDMSETRAYLYSRKVGDNSGFALVPGFEDGILMGYTAGTSALNLTTWDMFVRNNAQIDNLSIQTADMIPEGGSVALLGAGAGVIWLLKKGRNVKAMK